MPVRSIVTIRKMLAWSDVGAEKKVTLDSISVEFAKKCSLHHTQDILLVKKLQTLDKITVHFIYEMECVVSIGIKLKAWKIYGIIIHAEFSVPDIFIDNFWNAIFKRLVKLREANISVPFRGRARYTH